MMDMSFCPHEPDFEKMDGSFKSIDMSNLAYEMKFRPYRSYEELRDDTVLRDELDNIVYVGEDIRLKRMYQDKAVHYMLWEGRGVRPNAMEMLLKAIEKGNKEALEKQTPELAAGVGFFSGPAMLSCRRNEDGIYSISYAEGSDMAGTPIADLVPCCPNCHRPLPVGWMRAEAFQALSLMAYTSGGKTTFLLSMMADNWNCFNCLDSSLHVTAAHDPSYEKWYRDMKSASKRLIEDGQCPVPTEAGKERIPAIFLNIEYHGHRMILGLYDNSGETFQNMEPGDPRVIMLSCMDGHLFMIEPKDLNVQLPKKKKNQATEKQYTLMSVEQQAEYQKLHQGESVTGKSLLDVIEAEIRRRKQNWFEMYSNMRDAYQMNELGALMERQHLYGTVVKCDLLENLPEFAALPQKSILFAHKDMELNENQMYLQQELIREKIFERYVFRTEMQREKLLNSFSSASWHCISALGCDTEEIGDGNWVFDANLYNPIRLAEPIMTCVLDYANEHGWN